MDELTAQPAPEEAAQAEDTKPDADPETKKRWAEFRQHIANTKGYRRKLVRNWSNSIDLRRGKTFASQVDDDSVAVNLDWTYTKTKQAAMFSQIPKVRVTHSPESLQAGPWVAGYERRLNDTLVTAGIQATMEETLPDCINAAGVGIAMVAFESITEERQAPAIDLSIFPPELQRMAMQTGKLFGKPVPMESVPHKIAARYTIRRVSPADFLWPIDFTGSDFDNAPWLGYTGRLPWAEAAHRFNLTDEDKKDVLTEEGTFVDRLTNDIDKGKASAENKVGFDEIFYHEFQYDTKAKSFDTIRHLVFLHGKTDPVIDEPWSGQQEDKNNPGSIIGSKKKPVRVLTLTYISDDDIPPSDSAIARPQVLELNRGRTHISKQRARTAPWTWFDVNRLDPLIQTALMRGTWQHAIPVQGDGSRVIGSVEQPSIQEETFKFDEIAKRDAQDMWTIGPNQVGTGADVETKGRIQHHPRELHSQGRP
jgi:hypothetical protein